MVTTKEENKLHKLVFLIPLLLIYFSVLQKHGLLPLILRVSHWEDSLRLTHTSLEHGSEDCDFIFLLTDAHSPGSGISHAALVTWLSLCLSLSDLPLEFQVLYPRVLRTTSPE